LIYEYHIFDTIIREPNKFYDYVSQISVRDYSYVCEIENNNLCVLTCGFLLSIELISLLNNYDWDNTSKYHNPNYSVYLLGLDGIWKELPHIYTLKNISEMIKNVPNDVICVYVVDNWRSDYVNSQRDMIKIKWDKYNTLLEKYKRENKVKPLEVKKEDINKEEPKKENDNEKHMDNVVYVCLNQVIFY